MKRIKALTNWKKERNTNQLQTDKLQKDILQKNAFQTEAQGISMSSGAFILFALLFLFILSNLLSAELISPENLPTGCEVATKLDFGNQTGPTSAEQNWKSLSFIGLLLSAALVSIIYMIGKAIDAPGLMARAKTDLIQVAVTGIALVLLYGILSGLCTIDAREFGFGFSSFFDGANKYFEYSRASALSAYLSAAKSIMEISALSSISVNSPDFLDFGTFLKIGLYLKPFAGYGVTIGAINWFASLVLLSYSLVTGFMIVLNAIQVYFLNLLLPTGIVLRCFSPTRDFGGVIIAISIGLFVFYPILFSFSYMIVSIKENKADLTPPSLPDTDWSTKVDWAVAKILIYSSIPFGNVGIMLNSLSTDGDRVMDDLLDAYGEVSKTILPIYILPAINWIILAAIVRELSRVLGQEVDISGLARMI